MTKNEERYLSGYHHGIREAEGLIQNGMATGGLEVEAREEAHTAVETCFTEAGRAIAAWRLGYVRGFREVVR